MVRQTFIIVVWSFISLAFTQRTQAFLLILFENLHNGGLSIFGAHGNTLHQASCFTHRPVNCSNLNVAWRIKNHVDNVTWLRPSYSSNYRPTYVNNQRPSSNSVAPPNSNYRPTTRKPNVSNNFCTSSTPIDSNNGNWICWDQTSFRLRVGPNLTIEKFVIFYSQLSNNGELFSELSFRRQLCEQSERLNRAGLLCVVTEVSSSETDECPSNARKSHIYCYYDTCFCVFDQYYNIASQNMSPGHLIIPGVSPSLLQSGQNRPFITNSNLHQHFPAWVLPYINRPGLLPG